MERMLIEALPKAELHLHIEGSLEPDMALALAKRNDIELACATREELVASYQFANLAGFSSVYRSNSRALLTERDFYELTYAYMQRVRADNVLHAEIALAPQGATHRGVAAEVAIEGVLAAMEAALNDFGMTGGVIIGCQRNRGAADGLKMLRSMKPYRDRILALGLASMEVGYPPSLFERMFEEARDWGWKTVAHAGEEGPPEYIWEALDILKVDRIDHGVRCEEDPDLVRRLVDERIPLTVCPLSNVCLRVFPTLAEHNLARLLRAGVVVTINSDDPPYFGGYVNDNYIESARHLHLTEAELVELAKNSFRSAFIPDQQKDEYVQAVEQSWRSHGGEGEAAA